MATCKDILRFVARENGSTVKTCWIADVKSEATYVHEERPIARGLDTILAAEQGRTHPTSTSRFRHDLTAQSFHSTH